MDAAHERGRLRHHTAPAQAWSVAALVRAYALPIVVVLVCAAGLTAPRWWLLLTEPSAGVRVEMSPYGASRIGYDEALYTSSVRQVMDGDVPVSGPYLDGHQNDVPQQSSIWHTAAGLMARQTGDVFSSLALLSTLALIAAFALLYLTLLEITGSRWAAVAAIPIVLLGIHVFNQADNILALRRWDILKPVVTIDPEREWHPWLRYPSPVMTLAPFFAAVIAVPRAVETGARRWVAAASVALALLVYSYVFYWTAFALALAVWGAWLALDRDWRSVRHLALVGAVTAVIASPELVVLAWNALDSTADARSRVGLGDPGLHTEVFRQLAQRAVVTVALGAVILWRCGRRERLYVALAAAPVVLAALTGVVPQPWHFMTQVWGVFVIPAAVVAVVELRAMLPAAWDQRAAVALGIVSIAAVGYLAVLETRVIRHTDAAFAMTADEASAFEWMRGHVTRDETVVSPSITTNLYLASLTAADEYLGEGGFSRATDAELTDRMLRAQAAFGYPEADVFSRLDVTGSDGGFPVNDTDGNAAELERKLEDFLAFYTFSFEITEQGFPARVEGWRPTYAAFLSQQDVLAPYRADYLYCGARERYYGSGGAVAVAPGTYVTVAFAEGGVTVYRRVESSDPGATVFRGC